MSATSPTGLRNVTSSKYVLTSAQAKNVDSRPPFPNSANDNGASDVDISHQEVGDDLGNGGELAEIQEEEEGEMSREMLIAMAELTFDWLKPPEKKKKKRKRGRRRKEMHQGRHPNLPPVVRMADLSRRQDHPVDLVDQLPVPTDIKN